VVSLQSELCLKRMYFSIIFAWLVISYADKIMILIPDYDMSFDIHLVSLFI